MPTTPPPAAPKVPLDFVLPLGLAQILSWGTLYYGYALFAAPMERDLDLSRTETSAAFSLALVASAALSVPIGKRIDQVGGRRIMLAGSVLAAGLCALWSQIATGWHLFAVWIGLGFTLSMLLYEPVFAITRRALGANYARGILIITFLGGLAGTLGFPLVHGLISTFGWRTAAMALGAIQLLIVLPIHWWRLPADGATTRPPAPAGQSASAGVVSTPPSPGSGDPLRQALGRPIFWLLIAVFALSSFLFSAVAFHMVPFLIERGFSAGAAVLLVSFIGPCQVLGRFALLFGSTGRYLRVIGFVAFGLPILGLLVFATATPGSLWLWAFPLLYGIGLGLKTLVQATAAPEFIGEGGYGAIQGAFGAVAALARAAGPVGAALTAEALGGPGAMAGLFLAIAVAALIAFLLAARLAPAKPV